MNAVNVVQKFQKLVLPVIVCVALVAYPASYAGFRHFSKTAVIHSCWGDGSFVTVDAGPGYGEWLNGFFLPCRWVEGKYAHTYVNFTTP